MATVSGMLFILPSGHPTFFPVNTPSDARQVVGSAASDPKRALLVALVGFLKPLVEAYTFPRETPGEATQTLYHEY